MKLAVCLLTCGRHDLTRLCVETFVAANDMTDPRLVLLQADEPSQGPESGRVGAEAGFNLVSAPAARAGQMNAYRALLAAAIGADCEHMLWLENDWTTLRPLPWNRIGQADQVRLFGAWKTLAGGIRCGTQLIGAKTEIVWTAEGAGWERGQAHWAGGASIIRTDILARHADLPSLKAVIKASEPLDTLRPVGNIMASMGAARTAGRLD